MMREGRGAENERVSKARASHIVFDHYSMPTGNTQLKGGKKIFHEITDKDQVVFGDGSA
jgi:hypothetical protein